jgi:hypothetical protein
MTQQTGMGRPHLVAPFILSPCDYCNDTKFKTTFAFETNDKLIVVCKQHLLSRIANYGGLKTNA